MAHRRVFAVAGLSMLASGASTSLPARQSADPNTVRERTRAYVTAYEQELIRPGGYAA